MTLLYITNIYTAQIYKDIGVPATPRDLGGLPAMSHPGTPRQRDVSPAQSVQSAHSQAPYRFYIVKFGHDVEHHSTYSPLFYTHPASSQKVCLCRPWN